MSEGLVMSKNPRNQSGAKAEEKFENWLLEHKRTYTKHPKPQQKADGSVSKLKIDFIVDLADGNRMLIEISNQNRSKMIFSILYLEFLYDVFRLFM